MRLILIRHGEAIEEAPGMPDAARWLTEKGRKTTRRVADWLADKRKRRPAAIWTSPAVRAVQTSEIIVERVGLSGNVSVRNELAPQADVAELVHVLSAYDGPRPVAIVGHEPGLTQLAHRLLDDTAFPGLKKSGVLILSWSTNAIGEVEIVLDPKGMRQSSDWRQELDGAAVEPSSGQPAKI